MNPIERVRNFLGQRKRAYQLAFSSPAGQAVLVDLANFCRANETCFHEDARLHAALEGRREVWLRIQQHLGLSEEDLLKLYTGSAILKPEEDKA
jgi:hypothetical protein